MGLELPNSDSQEEEARIDSASSFTE